LFSQGLGDIPVWFSLPGTWDRLNMIADDDLTAWDEHQLKSCAHYCT